jgi:hypothetical protein
MDDLIEGLSDIADAEDPAAIGRLAMAYYSDCGCLVSAGDLDAFTCWFQDRARKLAAEGREVASTLRKGTC